MNTILKQYLRCYIEYLQDDWNQWLALAEFASNNHASETTNVSPFFANYGYDPAIELNTSPSTSGKPDVDAKQYSQRLADIHDHCRAEMLRSQFQYSEQADRRRQPAPRLQIGDQVWLDARHIQTLRPSRKLDNRRLGPFKVIEPIGTHAYRIDLPISMKIHNVFNVSRLSPAANNPFPSQQQDPAPPVQVDGNDEYLVQQVLDSKMVRSRLKYLVQWVGYDDPTWEPAENLDGVTAVDTFHSRYPTKPGPLP